MNREVQAVPSTTPRADAARPVLHFTGRADMEASLPWRRLEAAHLGISADVETWGAAYTPAYAIERTLRTGAAP